jgi:acyl-CoA thioester hydrolase
MANTPKIFKSIIKVQAEDLDELLHVNNVRYFDFLQHAATTHWYASVPTHISDGMRWVVKKHEIEYFKPAHLHDELLIKTWVKAFTGVTSERHYEIHKDNQLIVKAFTLWVAIDPLTMKPKRLPSNLGELYFEE